MGSAWKEASGMGALVVVEEESGRSSRQLSRNEEIDVRE